MVEGVFLSEGEKCNKIVGLYLKVLLYNFVGNKNT